MVAPLQDAIAEIHDAGVEAVLVDALEIDTTAGRQCAVASTEDHWPDEQGYLVDQPGDQRLRRGVRATDQEIPPRGGLQVTTVVVSTRVFAVIGAASDEK